MTTKPKAEAADAQAGPKGDGVVTPVLTAGGKLSDPADAQAAEKADKALQADREALAKAATLENLTKRVEKIETVLLLGDAHAIAGAMR